MDDRQQWRGKGDVMDARVQFNLRHFAISHVPFEIVWGRLMRGGAGGSVLGLLHGAAEEELGRRCVRVSRCAWLWLWD